MSVTARPQEVIQSVRRAVDAAAGRGAREVAIATTATGAPINVPLVREALRAEGFGLTSVVGEDGAYTVVHW